MTDQREPLKTRFLKDFGVNVPISGGFGQSREDPILIQDGGEPELVQMQVLRCIGKGRGVQWRTLGREFISPNVEALLIEDKQWVDEGLVTRKARHYFGVQRAAPSEVSFRMPIVFRDPKVDLALPYELGWVHFDEVTDHELAHPGLGKAIAYGAPGIKVTVYIYGDTVGGESRLRQELQRAVAELKVLNPAAVPAPALGALGEFAAFFVSGEDLTGVVVGGCRGRIVKVRLTTRANDGDLIDWARQTLGVIWRGYQTISH